MDLQQAINDCIDAGGGRVSIPAGKYEITTPLAIPRFTKDWMGALTPAVSLIGEGVNATVIYTNDPDCDLLVICSSNVWVSGMLLQGSQQATGKGRGIVVSDATNGSVLSRIHLSDLYIAATPRESLYIPDGYPHLVNQPAYDRISVACDYERVTFDSNLVLDSGLVYIGKWNTTQRFTACHFTNFKRHALLLNGADTTSCRDCIFEAGDNTKPYVEGIGAVATLLDHCYFEDHIGSAVFTAHDKASKGWAESNLTQRRRA